MSSHHTIRENQEPAILLLDPEVIMLEVLEDLLEWSPLLICSYKCLDWAVSHQLKIDGIIAPLEKKKEVLKLLEYQSPIKFIEENKEAFVSGIEYIVSTNNPSCNIFCGWKDISAMYYQSENIESKITFIDKNQQGFFLESKPFSKWYPEGCSIGIFPLEETKMLVNKKEKEIDRRIDFVIEQDQLLDLEFNKPVFFIEDLF